jgi:hypothetical protein
MPWDLQDFGALESLLAADLCDLCDLVCFFVALAEDEADAEASEEGVPWANTGPASRSRLMTGTSFLNIDISTRSDRSGDKALLARSLTDACAGASAVLAQRLLRDALGLAVTAPASCCP